MGWTLSFSMLPLADLNAGELLVDRPENNLEAEQLNEASVRLRHLFWVCLTASIGYYP